MESGRKRWRKRMMMTGPTLLLALLVLGAEAGELPETCQLPKVVSRCRAAFQRWWYNATSQTCEKFIFGGCGGNLNNFLSEQDCRQECVPDEDVKATAAPDQPGEETVTPTTARAVSKSGPHPEPGDFREGFQEFCAVPYKVGRCRASFPRWYFDIETRTCKMFIYGGCDGNKNNYLFKEHCLEQCNGHGEITEELDPDTHSHHFAGPLVHSTRAVVLAVLLAIMAAVLLGSMVVFFVKLCRRSPGVSLGTVWNTLDDKEYLMSNAYTL
uniref:Kunitz-type protease inhibitor 2 n=1 Tax=Pogona vitticeps TaxID=103695 RepID=A0ABM5ERY0_9SAUR